MSLIDYAKDIVELSKKDGPAANKQTRNAYRMLISLFVLGIILLIVSIVLWFITLSGIGAIARIILTATSIICIVASVIFAIMAEKDGNSY